MQPRYVIAKGTPENRGHIVGQILRKNIITILKAQEEAEKRKDGLTLHEWMPHAKNLFPFINDYAPETIKEIRGMSIGSDIQMEDLLLLSCTYEKWMNLHTAKGCTGFAAMGEATKTGELICGQTNDESLSNWAGGQMDSVIHHITESGLEILIYTHPGIPAYMGMNSAGLSVLWMYIDNEERAPGVPTCILLRELLNFTAIDSAVKFLETVPHAVPNNFLLAQQNVGICNIECSPTMFYPEYTKTALCHSNHILNDNMSKNDVEISDPVATTLPRYNSMASLLNKHYGKIDVEAGKLFLSNHDNEPASVCCHPHPDDITTKSLASMVFQPTAGNMFIAFGNACEVPFIKYSFK